MNTLQSAGHAYAIVYQVLAVVGGVGIIAGALAILEHYTHRHLEPIGRNISRLT